MNLKSYNQQLRRVARTLGTDSTLYQQMANDVLNAYEKSNKTLKTHYTSDNIIQIDSGQDIQDINTNRRTIRQERARIRENLRSETGGKVTGADVDRAIKLEGEFQDLISSHYAEWYNKSSKTSSIAHHTGRKLTYEEMDEFVTEMNTMLSGYQSDYQEEFQEDIETPGAWLDFE